MDLERSLANIKIDENPWRSHEQSQQPWGAPMPGGASGSTQGAWGHMSPQQMRTAWPDPNTLGQNVNEVLGIGGAQGNSQGWGPPMGPPNDFGDAAKIWSDPHADQPQFQPLHSQHRGLNGMMDAPGGDWMGAQTQLQQGMWSDPMKQDAGYYKHQQQQQNWNVPPGQMANNAASMYRIPHQQHRRGGNGPPMGMHPMGMRVGPPTGWNPQGGGYQMNRQQTPSDSWPNRGGMGQRGMGSGRGYPGVDMSMPPPPPIDMINNPGMPPVLSVRQLNNLWGADNKRVMASGQSGVPIDHFQQIPAPFGMPSKPQQAPNQFPIGGADDLMWHDPNGDLKKWQRDTGVSLWGDPEKCNERPVRNWKIAEGEEEDLEVALSKCPVPQKRNEDGTARLPFSLPSKRPIVVTGWGELPENDPNNPSKSDDMPSSSKWGDMTPVPSSEAPWYLPGQQPAPFVPDSPAWGQPPGPASSAGMMPLPMQNTPAADTFSTQQIADQLRYAVDKGYLDMSILAHPTLPTPVLQNMTTLLNKIPQLESVESEMNQLAESVRPDGEAPDGNTPTRWMNEVQKEEYNRLIIDVTTAKIEVRDLSKKINAGLAEAGMGSSSHDGNRPEAYHYSFLE